MKYYLTCTTPQNDVLLKVEAENEQQASEIALTKYQIKSVKSISTTKSKLNNQNNEHNYLSRGSYPYIKNTGKSFVKIFT